jgi:hypothetical protein
MKIIGVILIIVGLLDFGLSLTGVNITAFLGDEISMFTPWALMGIGGYLYRSGGASVEEKKES